MFRDKGPRVSSAKPVIMPAILAVLTIVPFFGFFFILSRAISVPVITPMMFTCMHFLQPRLVLMPALFTSRSIQFTCNINLTHFNGRDLEVRLTLVKKPEHIQRWFKELR